MSGAGPLPNDEAIRTARRKALFLTTYPSAIAICFGFDNGSCAPMATVVLAIPILFAFFLPAADIVATLARGTRHYKMPLLTSAYRITAMGLPIVCLVVARALAHPSVPGPCLP